MKRKKSDVCPWDNSSKNWNETHQALSTCDLSLKGTTKNPREAKTGELSAVLADMVMKNGERKNESSLTNFGLNASRVTGAVAFLWCYSSRIPYSKSSLKYSTRTNLKVRGSDRRKAHLFYPVLIYAYLGPSYMSRRVHHIYIAGPSGRVRFFSFPDIASIRLSSLYYSSTVRDPSTGRYSRNLCPNHGLLLQIPLWFTMIQIVTGQTSLTSCSQRQFISERRRPLFFTSPTQPQCFRFLDLHHFPKNLCLYMI